MYIKSISLVLGIAATITYPLIDIAEAHINISIQDFKHKIIESNQRTALSIKQDEEFPFKPNCADMQKHFNSLIWESGLTVKFQGFEKRKFRAILDNEYCAGGYITEISPMGTRICIGYIKRSTNLAGTKYFDQYGYGDNILNPSSQSASCRWLK
jgi:hypothetical protein